MKAGEASSEWFPQSRSARLGCSGVSEPRWAMRRRELGERAFGPLVATLDRPQARTVALIAPALVALMPSNAMRFSSSRRSSTPQAKAPCAPPPWSARLTSLTPDALPARTIRAGLRSPPPVPSSGELFIEMSIVAFRSRFRCDTRRGARYVRVGKYFSAQIP